MMDHSRHIGHAVILCGSQRSDRSKEITRLFEKHYPHVVLIVPTSYFAKRKLVELIHEHEKFSKGVVGNTVCDFTHFVYELLLAEGLPIRRLESFEESLLIRRIFVSRDGQEKLQIFNNLTRSESLIPHCLWLIHNLKQAGITPEEFQTKIQTQEVQKWDAFIGWIYSQYQDLLLRNHWYDVPGLFWEAEVVCNQTHPKYLKEKKVLLFDGFDDFTYSEVRVIKSLISHVDTVYIGLNYDPTPNRSDTYQIAHGSLQKLLQVLHTEAIEVKSFQSEEPHSVIQYIAENLFWRDIPKRVQEFSYKSDIFVTPHRNRYEEIREICRVIKKLLVENRTEPQKIALIYRQMHNVRDMIKDTFEEFGIPYFFNQPISMRETLLGQWLELWYAHLVEQNLFSYFSLLQHPLSNSNKQVREKFFLILRMLRIPENEDVGTLWNALTRGYQNPASFDFSSSLTQEDLKQCAEQIRVWQDWKDCFYRCTTTLDYIRTTYDLLRSVLAENDYLTLCPEDLNVYRKIQAILKMVSYLFGGVSFTVEEFSKLFLDTLKNCTLNLSMQVPCGVFCTDLPNIRNLKFDYIFVGGVEEGFIPLKHTINVLYTEKDVAHLRDLGLPIDNFRVHTQREWLFFQQIFESAQKGLYLSYANYSEMHEERQPSLLIKEVIEICHYLSFHPQCEMEESIPGCFRLPCSMRELKNTEFYLKKATLPEKYPDEYYRFWVLTQREKNEKNIFTGLIQSENLRAWLRQRFNMDYRFSVDQVETFQQCPYLFFIRRVLNLKEWEEYGFEPTRLLLGKWAHSALQRILKNYLNNVLNGHGLEEILNTVLTEIIESDPESIIYPKSINRITQERLFRILLNFITSKNFLPTVPDVWQPTYFEVSFGIPAETASSEVNKPEPFTLVVNNSYFRLSGRIDRVDVHKTENAIRIVDYKWGNLPKLKEILNYSSIQLQLYSLVAEKYLFPGQHVESAYFISIKDHKKQEIIGEKSKLIKEDIEKNISNLCMSMINKIYTGDFSYVMDTQSDEEDRPQVRDCSFCSWGNACRYKPISSLIINSQQINTFVDEHDEL